MGTLSKALVGIFLAIDLVLGTLVFLKLTSDDAYAVGRGGGQNTRFSLVSGTMTDGKEAFFVVDSEAKRVLVYNYDGSGRLTLLNGRDIQYDVQIEQFGKLEPSLADIKKNVEEQ